MDTLDDRTARTTITGAMAGRRHPLLASIAMALFAGAFLVAFLPALRSAAASGPVHVDARDVTVSVDRPGTHVVVIPIAATHVALHWTGARDARVTLAVGADPWHLGADVALEAADASPADAGETYTDVLVANHARALRLTSDRALGTVTVVAIDAGASPATPTAAAATAQPAVITRAQWGADESLRLDSGGHQKWPPEFSPLQAFVVHHTAGANSDPDPASTVRAIYYFDAITRGWGDLGYNYLIDSSGRIYEGRWARTYATGESHTEEDQAGNLVRGAHATGYNDGIMGIAVMGTFDTVLPTTAARSSLEGLIAWESERHAIDPTSTVHYVNSVSGLTADIAAVSGHRDVQATDCPGTLLYGWLPTARTEIAARISSTSGPTNDHAAPAVSTFVPMATDPTGAKSIPFGLTFTEPVSGLAPADFTLGGTSTGWTVASVTGKGGTYAVTVTNPSPGTGTLVLTLKAGTVTDLGGNAGPASDAVATTADWAPDTTAPTLGLYPAKDSSGFYDVRVQFSEPVTGFDSTDVVLGGTSNAITPWRVNRVYGSGNAYTFYVDNATTPAAGTLTISLPAGRVQDMAGNPNVAASVTVGNTDTTPPTTSTPITWLRSSVSLTSPMSAWVVWDASDTGGSGIAGYDLARSVDGGAFSIIVSGLRTASYDVGLSVGHTYRFEVRARDNAGNVGIWAVGAAVSPSVVEQTPSTVVTYYTTWPYIYSSAFSGGSERYTSTTGAWVRITTTARSIAFVTTRGPDRGRAEVYVDGSYVTTIDLYASTTQYRYVAYVRNWGSSGTHNIRIYVLGTSGRPRVDVDAFEVLR